VSVERIMELVKVETEADWNLDDTKPEPNWPQKGDIEFVDYSTKYRYYTNWFTTKITC
jgi:hypothetical protein